MTNVEARQVADNKGYTLLELVVVIFIISILIAVALDRYNDLLVVVERNRMEHDLGVMRSAVSMQVAEHFVASNMGGLQQLVGSNPMELLTEKPNNYIGVFELESEKFAERGIWYFDKNLQALIYLVRNSGFFLSELTPAQARFKILPVFSEKKQGDSSRRYQSGLVLEEIEPYEWLRDQK